MTEKGHQKFLGVKWNFFPKGVIQKFGPRNLFSLRSELGAKSPAMLFEV